MTYWLTAPALSSSLLCSCDAPLQRTPVWLFSALPPRNRRQKLDQVLREEELSFRFPFVCHFHQGSQRMLFFTSSFPSVSVSTFVAGAPNVARCLQKLSPCREETSRSASTVSSNACTRQFEDAVLQPTDLRADNAQASLLAQLLYTQISSMRPKTPA